MTSNENNPDNLTGLDHTIPYQMGQNPDTDAWFTVFFLENHLDYYAYPKDVATPEQVGFMVVTEQEERYYPCSDHTFQAIMSKHGSDYLQTRYNEALNKVLQLNEEQIEDEKEKQYLKSLLRITFQHETRDEIIIPSRLEKRLLQIFINRTHIEDPYIEEKSRRNARAASVLQSSAFKDALNHIDLDQFNTIPTNLSDIRDRLQHIEIRRLLALTAETSLWGKNTPAFQSKEDFLSLFETPITGPGVEPLFDFLGTRISDETSQKARAKKILWLVDEAGEILIDLTIIRYLARLDHKIIVALKGGPLFTRVNFFDAQEDETLKNELEGTYLIKDKILSKNDLIRILKSDNNIFVLSDGTKETINLLLTSVSFSRFFKEVDAVISRGPDQKRRFFDTHFQFTQDVYNISREADGSVSIAFKPRHPSVIKFSHEDLEKKAKVIINEMISAKKQGMTVVFYSGIIGSIPGKIEMAKQIMSVFIQHLKEQFSHTHIINPSEYYELGMDADDLMYMWEIVQRSGHIDIWRFQTYEDIVQAFRIMGKKVPPEWVGKDATFSTGCTKEIHIAMEVQQAHPEMQLIAPPREKFMRRKEYGIGKMYDRRLRNL